MKTDYFYNKIMNMDEYKFNTWFIYIPLLFAIFSFMYCIFDAYMVIFHPMTHRYTRIHSYTRHNAT